ncbi:MAG: transporter substrate-binding domain-containing protein [Clostridia bacterium]|nr:transporter substrate-binding domain-containing protein [Clostridia bacterium]
MKKFAKVIVTILAIATLVGCCCAFTACNKDKTAEAKVKVIDIELTAESYAYILKKGDATSEVGIAANELLAELKANGELDNIINSFFDGNATFAYTSPASKDGCLVVATNAYFPPFEYYNGDKLTGVDMKIASLLAEKLGKTLYILDEEFDSIFTSVSTGEAAIGMAGITINETRKLSYDFTDEYYTSAQVLMVAANDTTYDNCKTAADVEAILAQQSKVYSIGTQNATTGYMYTAGDEDFGYDGFKNLTCKGYSNGALAAQDLVNGVVNGVIIDKQPALMIAKGINK